MNWVGGARNRVRQNPDRKSLQKNNGRQTAARHHNVLSPMRVTYRSCQQGKSLRVDNKMSQDLIGLYTLNSIHDPENNKQTTQPLHLLQKQPNRVRLVNNTYTDMELPMSPTTQSSNLDLFDITTDSQSFYYDQPKVSTMKRPNDTNGVNSAPHCYFDETFTDSSIHIWSDGDNSPVAPVHVTATTDSLFPVDTNSSHQAKHTMDNTTESIFKYGRPASRHAPRRFQSTFQNPLFNSVLNDSTHYTDPIRQVNVPQPHVNAPKKPKLINVPPCTEKPLTTNDDQSNGRSFNWNHLDWYNIKRPENAPRLHSYHKEDEITENSTMVYEKHGKKTQFDTCSFGKPLDLNGLTNFHKSEFGSITNHTCLQPEFISTTNHTLQSEFGGTTNHTLQSEFGGTTNHTLQSEFGGTTNHTLQSEFGGTTNHTLQPEFISTTNHTLQSEFGGTTNHTLQSNSNTTIYEEDPMVLEPYQSRVIKNNNGRLKSKLSTVVEPVDTPSYKYLGDCKPRIFNIANNPSNNIRTLDRHGGDIVTTPLTNIPFLGNDGMRKTKQLSAFEKMMLTLENNDNDSQLNGNNVDKSLEEPDKPVELDDDIEIIKDSNRQDIEWMEFINRKKSIRHENTCTSKEHPTNNQVGPQTPPPIVTDITNAPLTPTVHPWTTDDTMKNDVMFIGTPDQTVSLDTSNPIIVLSPDEDIYTQQQMSRRLVCRATTAYPHCDKTDETTELSFNNTLDCTVASVTDVIKPVVTNTNNNKQLIQYTDDQDQSQTATCINRSINNSDVMNDMQNLNNSIKISSSIVMDTVGEQTINIPYKDVAVQTSVSENDEEIKERFKMSASTQTHVDSELHVLAITNNVRYPVRDTINCLSPDDKKDLIKVFVDNCDSIVSILTSKLPDISDDDMDAFETLEIIEKKMDTIRKVTDSITNKLVYHCLMSKLK